MYTLLLVILVLLLIGALPTWPYSSGWGYTPSGLFGAIVLVLLVMMLMGRA
jgi:hypothetical protein